MAEADDVQADVSILSEGGDDVGVESQESDDSEIVEAPEESPDEDKEAEDDEEDKGDEEEKEVKDEEEKEEPEEKLEIRRSRPTVTQIKAKYPAFFKDFPDMKHVLFRENEYAALFPTVDDAKDASDKAENFDHLSTLLNSGKTDDFTEFLKGVEGLQNIAANFLPALHKASGDMYFKITTPIAESLTRAAYRAGVQHGNDNLKNAALQVALWAFGDVGFATGEKQSEPLKAGENKEKSSVDEERKAFYKEKFDDTQNYVNTGIKTRLKAEIKRGLDPNGVFTDFTIDMLSREILNEVGNQLEQDTRHMATMTSLWKQAHKAGFTGDWKDRILSTYLSRARAIMPAIRARMRSQALANENSKNQERARVAGKSADRKEVRSSSSANGAAKSIASARDVDWSRTSDMDFLEDRVTVRKK